MIKQILAAVLFASVIGSAHAELQWDGKLVLDTKTALQWRVDQVPSSATWEQITAPFNGWRLATRDEFLEFWGDAGLTTGTTFFMGFPDEKAETFRQLILNWAQPFTFADMVFASLWLTGPETQEGYLYHVVLSAGPQNSGFFYATFVSGTLEPLSRTFVDTLIHVRPLSPIPEPDVALAMLVGLATLATRMIGANVRRSKKGY